MPQKNNSTSLPKSPREDELQELSFRALWNALPVQRFLLRNEEKDKGVDASIELKENGECLNMRCQVQLKGTDTKKFNKDRSVSLSIDIYNINYLVNGGNALYVLYIDPRNELRYIWSRDARKALDNQQPGWQTKGTATIRFRRMLLPAALDQIWEDIRREAAFDRDVRAIIDKCGAEQKVLISVNPERLSATDPNELADLLENAGFLLITSGHAAEVVTALSTVIPIRPSSAKLRVVSAYGSYMQGRYRQAQADIAEALLRRNDLLQFELDLVEHLRNACAYQIGDGSLENYKSWLRTAIDNSEGLSKLLYSLEEHKHQLAAVRDNEGAEKLLDEIRQIVGAVEANELASTPVKLNARITQLYAHGACHVFGLSHHATVMRSQWRMGYIPSGTGLSSVFRSMRTWEASLGSAIADCERLQLWDQLAEALYTRAFIRIGIVANAKFMTPEDDSPLEGSVRDAIEDDLRAVISICNKRGMIEAEVRATSALAEIMSIDGRHEEAKAIAQSILPKAEAMGYHNQIDVAREHVAGTGQFTSALARLRRGLSRDEDYSITEQSDEQLRAAAKFIREAKGLPREREAVLHRDWLALQMVASERIHWCRHIELLQSLKHTESPLTDSAVDPVRYCLCKLKGYETTFGLTEADTVIASFKGAYCTGCAERDPKGPEAQTE